MKKLITKKMILELKRKGQTELLIDNQTLLTPSAQDAIREYSVTLVNATARNVAQAPSACPCANDMSTGEVAEQAEIVEMVMKLLEEKGLLKDILD